VVLEEAKEVWEVVWEEASEELVAG